MVDTLFCRILNVSVSVGDRWKWFQREVKLSAMERFATLANWKGAEEKLIKKTSADCHLESENPGGFEAQLKKVQDIIAQLEAETYKCALIRARGEQPTKWALCAEAKM